MQQGGSTALDVSPNRLDRVFPHGDHPLLVSLAHDPEATTARVHIAHVEPAQLTDT